MIVAMSAVWPLLPSMVPAVVLALAAAAVGSSSSAERGWRIAQGATVVAALAVAVSVVVRITAGAEFTTLARLDSVTVVMAALVALVGWVVIRFSVSYLAGDPREQRYARRMLATLAAVSVVVVANHLVVLLVAWAAASIALHGLLTHFGDRPVAVAVAHKKFLLARCADVCMVGATVAFGLSYDTLRIDGLAAAVAADGVGAGGRLAIFLVALAAVLKCAQLPFHGWLIQVMEAPTPVSALLHAGIVNLGGFVLLRFAPVVDAAVETRALLVVVGVATAVGAGLVMTTRVSVKVALAWSTCAQMGFMLMQCGLGLWEMALLHLLAHSAYKAHAFLSAGGVVLRTQRRRLAPPVPEPTVRSTVVAAGAAIVAVVVVGLAWQALPGTSSLSAAVWVLLGIVALALAPLTAPGGRVSAGAAVGVVGVPLAYLALHEVFVELVPSGRAAPVALLVVTAVGFAALFVVRAACAIAPAGRLGHRLRPWIYGGLFLDDAFTRWAFRISPPPQPQPRRGHLPTPAVALVLPVARGGGSSGSLVGAASSPAPRTDVA